MKKKKTAKRSLQPRVIVSDMLAGVWKSFLIISFLFVILGIWRLHTGRILPYTRRLFTSYSSFYEKAAADTFHAYPKELPPGVEHTRYFYYTGSLDKVTEVSFTVNEEEYQELKETYLSVYTEEADNYWKEQNWHYVFNEPVTSEFLETEHLDYLGETMHEEADHYTILVYCSVDEGEKGDTKFGVFFNDENRELVFFSFQDAGKNGRPKNDNDP